MSQEYINEAMEKLRENNILAVDPSFPMLSVKPIKLARIATTGISTDMPKRMLRFFKSFAQKGI